MRRKRLLALGALLVAAAMAGCFGSSEIPDEQLSENATYDWNTSATVTFDISRSSYTSVVNVSNETLEVWQRDAIEGERPVRISALKFRFPNGTVVTANHSNLSASTNGDRTTLELPTDSGKVAYTAPRKGKQFGTPVFVDGSYAVVLPPNTRVGIPFLSQVSPGDYNASVDGDRMTVRWGNLTEGGITVRYYLQRDILLFTAAVVIAVLVGSGGALYYWRQIRGLEKRREEIGVDIDYDDDDDLDDDGPPPGM